MNLIDSITLEQMIESDRLEEKYYGREHITGFLDLFPVTRTFFHKILSGERDEDDLSTEDILDIHKAPPGEYPLLLFTVLIDKAYRSKGALEMLFSDRIEYYDSLSAKEIRFNQVITENVTSDGHRFSEKLGFEKVLEKEDGTAIYRLSYRQFRHNVIEGLKGR